MWNIANHCLEIPAESLVQQRLQLAGGAVEVHQQRVAGVSEQALQPLEVEKMTSGREAMCRSGVTWSDLRLTTDRAKVLNLRKVHEECE